jgi:hypothetical protein
MSASNPIRKAVVGDLHTLQCRFVIRCKTCGHQVTYTPAGAVAAFGWNRLVADLRGRLKCSSCGASGERLDMGLHDADRLEMWKREGFTPPHPEDVKTRAPGNAGKYAQRTRLNRMSWQGTLAEMKEYGTIVFATCPTCSKFHEEVDVDQLLGLMGPEGDLWDRWSNCPTPGCAGRAFFVATPARGTPMRPLRTSLVLEPWVDDAIALEPALRPRRAGSG